MKKEFMSPECSWKTEQCASSSTGKWKNKNKKPKMSKEKAKELLLALRLSGLEGEDGRALEIVSLMGRKRFMDFAEPYGLKNALGELVFVPGTLLSRLIDDILFNKELCHELFLSISFFRKTLETKIPSSISEWAEANSWSGVISEFGVDYMKKESLERASFEAIWMDYDMVFPRGISEMISAEYGMDAYHFSLWLNLISYCSGLAEDERKLLDHVFLDRMMCPKNLLHLFPLWNSSENKVGNIILALDYLNGLEESHWDMSLEKKVWNIMAKYDIAPHRIGFSEKGGKEYSSPGLSIF